MTRTYQLDASRQRPLFPVEQAPARAAKKPRHTITEKQNNWYWREWARARKALLRAGFSRAEADDQRHIIHEEKLGEDKSHVHFNDGDFELVMSAFYALSEPDNMDIQIRLLTGHERRLIEGIKRLAKGREHYLQAVMDDLASYYGHSDWTRLKKVEDLTKFRSTLARRLERRVFEQEGTEETESAEAGEPDTSTQTETALPETGSSAAALCDGHPEAADSGHVDYPLRGICDGCNAEDVPLREIRNEVACGVCMCAQCLSSEPF